MSDPEWDGEAANERKMSRLEQSLPWWAIEVVSLHRPGFQDESIVSDMLAGDSGSEYGESDDPRAEEETEGERSRTVGGVSGW